MSLIKLCNFLLLSFMVAAVLTKRIYQPKQLIKLALAVSKATYLPIPTKRFIKNGRIVENPSTFLPRFFLGFIPLLPKYDPAQDKIACNIHGWTAKSYENRETELLMFRNDQQKLVVFGFRGTEPIGIQDWLANFDLLPARITIDKTTFSTHKGFRDRYGYIASWFEREYQGIPANYTIVLTGHSLGAAEATIAAVYAAGKLKRRPDVVVTYGSPYPGLLSLKKYYNLMVGCDRTIRITAKYDPFTRVPMTIPGYTHVCDGTEVDGKTGLIIINAHILYKGYERGIKNKYDMNEINFGCDQMLS